MMMLLNDTMILRRNEQLRSIINCQEKCQKRPLWYYILSRRDCKQSGTALKRATKKKCAKLSFEAFLGRERSGWWLEVKQSTKGSKGFVLVWQRWLVERTLV